MNLEMTMPSENRTVSRVRIARLRRTGRFGGQNSKSTLNQQEFRLGFSAIFKNPLLTNNQILFIIELIINFHKQKNIFDKNIRPYEK
jgi:hypothetical protein